MDNKKIEELKAKMRNVPFGNSVFQNKTFTDGKETQERRYRHCLLQINQKLNALQECQFSRRRAEIDILEIEDKKTMSAGFDKDRLEVDLDEQKYHLNIQEKLIEDAIIELKTYSDELDRLPDFTREEFELAEYGYWNKRLLGDAQLEVASSGSVSVGTIESLKKIGINVGKNKHGQIAFQVTSQEKINDDR